LAAAALLHSPIPHLTPLVRPRGGAFRGAAAALRSRASKYPRHPTTRPSHRSDAIGAVEPPESPLAVRSLSTRTAPLYLVVAGSRAAGLACAFRSAWPERFMRVCALRFGWGGGGSRVWGCVCGRVLGVCRGFQCLRCGARILIWGQDCLPRLLVLHLDVALHDC